MHKGAWHAKRGVYMLASLSCNFTGGFIASKTHTRNKHNILGHRKVCPEELNSGSSLRTATVHQSVPS